MNETNQAFVLRENSEWLRYVLWASAVGLGILAANAIAAPVRDTGKIIGSLLGVLLFGFSGFVFRTRCIMADPVSRTITITSKGFRKPSREQFGFDEVRRILVVSTLDYDSDLMPANRWQKRWLLALDCKGGNVQLNQNYYNSKEQALRDAEKLRQLLGIEIADTPRESIAQLSQNYKVEAITLARRELGMTLQQAKEHVENQSRKERQ
jgi:hypothetical protein